MQRGVLYIMGLRATQAGKFGNGACELFLYSDTASQNKNLYTLDEVGQRSGMRLVNKLRFRASEDAMRYCKKNKIDVKISGAASPKSVNNASYSDNYRNTRKLPWTH